MDVYCSETIAPSALERLKRNFNVVDDFEHPERLCAIITRRAPVTGELLRRCPNMKVISMHGVSRDQIDTKTAAELGIPVPNVPHLGAEPVAELAVSLLMALNRKLKMVDSGLREGRWHQFGAPEFVCHEMNGKILGNIGCGDIAQRVAQIMHAAFGVTNLCYNPHRTAEECAARGFEKVESLRELFERSDFVNVSAALNSETYHMINADVLSCAKPGCILVSTARGGIVEETALYDALAAGKLGGAALDVWEQEPPAPEHPLLGLENFIGTFHIGGSAVESLERVSNKAVDHVFQHTGVEEKF